MTTEAVQQEVRHLHDLLSLRDLFADWGVPAEELRRYDAAIVVARKRPGHTRAGGRRRVGGLTRKPWSYLCPPHALAAVLSRPGVTSRNRRSSGHGAASRSEPPSH